MAVVQMTKGRKKRRVRSPAAIPAARPISRPSHDSLSGNRPATVVNTMKNA